MAKEKKKPAAAAPQSDERLMDLLQRDVSWKSIQDVLTYELPSPFGAETVDASGLDDLANQLSPDDVATLKENPEAVGQAIGTLLLERELLTESQLAEAQAVKARTGQPLWRVLMQLKYVESENLSSILSVSLVELLRVGPDPLFVDQLVKEKLMTRAAVETAWKEAREKHQRFTAYLRDTGLVSDTAIAMCLAEAHGMEFSDLEDMHEISPKLLAMIPRTLLLRHHTLPLDMLGDELCMAIASPHHRREIERLNGLVDVQLRPILVPRNKFSALMATYVPESIIDSRTQQMKSALFDESDMSAAQLLDRLLAGLVTNGGTDLHLEPLRDTARVRYRIDGVLHDVMTLDQDIYRKVANRIKSISGMDMTQTMTPQDGNLSVVIDDATRTFRTALTETIYGEMIALRLSHQEMLASNFEQLGMLPAQVSAVRKMLSLPGGMILVAGPVGSGKTTTLYASLNYIDCFSRKIVSIEDPVEFEIAGINQVQVNDRRDLTYAVGMRALLRQDPDVIMIGEIRDDETADIAVRASMTGTIVISTIHANSAPLAYSSLLQLNVRPYMAANAVAGVIFQRLIRRICENCRESYTASPELLSEIGMPTMLRQELFRGAGCEACFHTGYSGRIGVYEVLPVTDDLRSAVASAMSNERLFAVAVQSGLMPLHEHALYLVRQGITTADELLRIL